MLQIDREIRCEIIKNVNIYLACTQIVFCQISVTMKKCKQIFGKLWSAHCSACTHMHMETRTWPRNV